PDGSVACVVPRRRLETRAGEISKGYTVRDAEIEAWGRRVCGRLPDAAGPITLQCFRRRDGHLAFIEINPRFGGGFPLSLHAGADYPRWLLEWALGLPSTASSDAWLGCLGLPADAATVASLVDCYRAHRPSIGLYPDVASAMRSVCRRARAAIISDGPLAAQQRKVEALALQAWFDPILLTDRWG